MIRTRVLTLAMMSVAVTSAQADETNARQILAKMAEYLAGQQSLSFDYDSSLEIVTPENQKLAITSSGSIAMERPGNIRVNRRGGFASVEAVFDGNTLTVAQLDANVYAQFEVTGSVDTAVGALRTEFGNALPGADLLSPDVGKILMADVTNVKDLGSGVIRGEECDHLAFRTPDVDWQIWVSQGDTPYPCRYVITTKAVTGSPQYTLDISSWGAGLAPMDFTFAPAAGAAQVEIKSVPDLDEIAGIYSPEGGH